MQIVTLVQAQVSFFHGYGLRGFIDIEDAGRAKKYAFRLPTPEEPSPPGWASIERLTGITAQQVIESWEVGGESNTAALAAVMDLSSRFRGEKFVASEVSNGDGISFALELAALDVNIEAPKRLRADTDVQAAVVPPRYVLPTNISEQVPELDAANITVMFGDPNNPDAIHRFIAPDQNNRTPEEWWFVETFTGIAHERVANGWDRRRNDVLTDAVRLLGAAIQGHPAPIRADGTVDVNLWRRQLIRARQRLGIKPFIFLGRPDHNSEHTRAVFYDATGDYLYRANVDPGNSRGAPALITDSDGKIRLEHLDDEDLLQAVLNRYIRFASSGRPPRPKSPPKTLLIDLIRLPERSWPIVKGIIRIPTVREDGSIITQPGYDRATQLWFAPEFDIEPIPDHPTQDDVRRAKALIMTPLADFPFVDEGARAGALASLFEQLVRPMIRGPRPLYIFDAPEQGQGTGKSLLAKVIQTIITGCEEPVMSALGKREEEIEKRITSLLRQQLAFIICDNLTADVTSEALQQLATSERWQARLLNTNDVPVYAQISTWVLTLNAAKMNRDIARRSVLVRLDSKEATPFERTGFRIGDVLTWSRERRASIIRACLILVRCWVNAGRPVDKEVVRGSFEQWCKVIGGLLKFSGFEGLPKALKATADRIGAIDDHRMLLRAWAGKFGVDRPIPAFTVGELAAEYGCYENVLPKRWANNTVLGRAMYKILWGGLIGSLIDGYRVDVSPTLLNGFTGYVLVHATTPKAVPVRATASTGSGIESGGHDVKGPELPS